MDDGITIEEFVGQISFYRRSDGKIQGLTCLKSVSDLELMRMIALLNSCSAKFTKEIIFQVEKIILEDDQNLIADIEKQARDL